eukprot:TRINITY_DN4130_c0_g3_i1.p1 TRINITY_DN4130_c0_g3~~TRINITY_DN4130_c0_g3_i1.p1  ORF type:complete len:1142 (+),score=480.44 TRINITY_DN4130_c0_g3_i1:66-3491(+)
MPDPARFAVGDRIFFLHRDDSWLLGTYRGPKGKLHICEDAQGQEFEVSEVHRVVESSLNPVDDLLRMSYLHDSTLMHHVRQRYWNDVIYTNIGSIVMALNPYNFHLPNYTDDKMPDYIREGAKVLVHGSAQLPHSWSVAHHAYCLMQAKRQDQTILVTGESGAGKTEAVKIVMKYIGELSTKAATDTEKTTAREINRKVISTSPILEAFGNAKTVRNDNSSRFGKFMRLKFTPDGVLAGAHITPYLLERSRVISHSRGERGYHAFYQLVCGATVEEKKRMGLGGLLDYRALIAGDAATINGVDDEQDHAVTREALTAVGITQEEQTSIYNALAAILHLTNCVFRERDGKAYLTESDMVTVRFVASNLLFVDGERLIQELTNTKCVVAGETFNTFLDKSRATEQRDSLCKSLYEKVFLWLVGRVNALIDAPDGGGGNWLGLLDIFGFESFEKNSFEQLCINLTNEQLQQHYNHHIFTKDMHECRGEGINTDAIKFADNQPTLDMVVGALGVLSLLDEEVQLRKGTDQAFAAKLQEAQGAHASYAKHRMDAGTFGIRHYASTVWYDVQGWREKNMDTLKDKLKELLRSSADPFIQQLLPAPVDMVGRKPTVARMYKDQLQQLMKVINGSNPHWIRCVKPHSNKKPRNFHGGEVMTQLRCAGVLDTVRIRKMGYPVRLPYSDFMDRYRCVVAVMGTQREVIQAVLTHLQIPAALAQVGKTKVFLKTEVWSQLEEARGKALARHALIIQMCLRQRQSNQRAAVQLAKHRVRTIQAFARTKRAMFHMRRQEYALREEELVAAARRLHMVVQEEERTRLALMKLELEHLQGARDWRERHYQEIMEKWYMDRPIRDALQQTDFKVQEEGARAQLERFEQEQLLTALDVLKEDFDVMQQRQLQREQLEEEQRLRMQEAVLLEQKQKARLAWARAKEEQRMIEEAQYAEDYRKYMQLQRVSDNIHHAKELYQTERARATKVKRSFEPESFCSSLPSRPGFTASRARSPAASRSTRAASASVAHSDAQSCVMNPTFSRLSMATTAAQMYTGSPTRQRHPQRHDAPPQPPKQVKADPKGSHSLDMVKRLQRMSKVVTAHPYRLIAPRCSPFSAKSPNNPSHPDWAPGPDGVITLPNGQRCHVDELPTELGWN